MKRTTHTTEGKKNNKSKIRRLNIQCGLFDRVVCYSIAQMSVTMLRQAREQSTVDCRLHMDCYSMNDQCLTFQLLSHVRCLVCSCFNERRHTCTITVEKDDLKLSTDACACRNLRNLCPATEYFCSRKIQTQKAPSTLAASLLEEWIRLVRDRHTFCFTCSFDNISVIEYGENCHLYTFTDADG